MAKHKVQEQNVKKYRFWEAHVRAWSRSGLSQNEYCRQNNLRSNRLGYWKKKIARQTSLINFVPMPIPTQRDQLDAKNSTSGITICLKKARRIKIDNDFVCATLAKVISVLENQP